MYHGREAPASISLTFTNKFTQFLTSSNLMYSVQFWCTDDKALLKLWEGQYQLWQPCWWKAWHSLTTYFPCYIRHLCWFIPLVVPDSEVQQIANRSVWCQAIQNNWSFKASVCSLMGPWRSSLLWKIYSWLMVVSVAIHKRVVYLLFAVNEITNLYFRSAVSGPGNISVNADLQLEMIINTNNFYTIPLLNSQKWMVTGNCLADMPCNLSLII